LACGVISPT